MEENIEFRVELHPILVKNKLHVIFRKRIIFKLLKNRLEILNKELFLSNDDIKSEIFRVIYNLGNPIVIHKLENIEKELEIKSDIIKTVINILKKKILEEIPHIEYNGYIIKYSDINSFLVSKRENNDSNNKLREHIIGGIINKKIPIEYYKNSEWEILKTGIDKYLARLIEKYNIENINNIECKQKGGRGNNYDFDLIINKNNNFLIELKFNTSTVDKTPQFVSPIKPSKYLSSSYEEYYYDNYLKQISEKYSLKLPNREEYLKKIHSPNPKCMSVYQINYYKGCKKDKNYSGEKEYIDFYEYSKKLSKESIIKFIGNTDLNMEKLSNYLKETQKNKIYMLYKNNEFYLEEKNMDEYIIEKCVKEPEKTRYLGTTKSGRKLKILLRWKNGNGIAFPAFQIS